MSLMCNFCGCCSDEIYANSVFKRADYVSMMALVAEAEPELQETAAALCHTVFGLSKDW